MEKTELERYKQAYDLFMEYWDSFDKEQQKDIDKELKEIGL